MCCSSWGCRVRHDLVTDQRQQFIFPSGMVVKKKKKSASAGDARDSGSVPGWGNLLGGGNGKTLQYSCLLKKKKKKKRVQRNWSVYSPWGHKE